MNVSFSESVNNVSIGSFNFSIEGLGLTHVGEITKVEMHSDTNFNDDSIQSSTTDATTLLSGRYFKVSVNPNEDISDTYVFRISPLYITDDLGNTLQIFLEDNKLGIDVNTKKAPTVDSLSIVDVLITPKSGDFEINVTFSEEVNNVDIGDFRLVLKDANTSTDPTFGTIVVEKHSDSTFTDTSPSTTDTTTTQLSGTYFKVKVSPQDDLMTDINVTDYAFQVIDDTANSSSIEDGAGNALGAQGLTDIIRATADINIDTAHPKTESISLVTSGTQTSTFDVNVTFSESINNVDIGNFELQTAQYLWEKSQKLKCTLTPTSMIQIQAPQQIRAHSLADILKSQSIRAMI